MANGKQFTQSELAHNTVHVATIFAKFALALAAHEKGKSDPTKNVSTGQALYDAEVALKDLAHDYAEAFPEQLANITASLNRALPQWDDEG